MRAPLTSLLILVLVCGCSEPNEEVSATPTPSFEARGDLSGFVITYVDDDGPHAVMSRNEVPEEFRSQVRIKKLTDESTPIDHVWVADLTKEGAKGYPVRSMSREDFDKLIDIKTGVVLATNESATGGEDVIIYGADWCGACKSAASFLKSQQVPFVEKNIEEDASARKEMQAKAKAAGVVPSGIPVIDARGTILTGYSEQALTRALKGKGKPAAAAPSAPPSSNVY